MKHLIFCFLIFILSACDYGGTSVSGNEDSTDVAAVFLLPESCETKLIELKDNHPNLSHFVRVTDKVGPWQMYDERQRAVVFYKRNDTKYHKKLAKLMHEFTSCSASRVFEFELYNDEEFRKARMSISFLERLGLRLIKSSVAYNNAGKPVIQLHFSEDAVLKNEKLKARMNN